jgi:hypothetical protein
MSRTKETAVEATATPESSVPSSARTANATPITS